MKFFTCISLTLFAHIVLVIIFSFSVKQGSNQKIILKKVVRVNLVALPEKKNISQKIAALKVKGITISKTRKKKSKKKNRTSKLKQSSILKKIQERLRKKQQKNILSKLKNKKNIQDKKDGAEQAGNKISSALQSQIQNYLENLKVHVHSFWSIPQWVSQNNLKVEITVYLDQNGRLIRKEYFSESINADFNAQAFGALDRASPYPVPPEELLGLLQSSGIVFSFP